MLAVPVQPAGSAPGGEKAERRPWEIAMLEPPKSRMIAALHGTKVKYVFPDGADHIHIKAYGPKS